MHAAEITEEMAREVVDLAKEMLAHLRQAVKVE
jgi:hypothetical protein